MADFTALKTAIQQYIAQNGNKEITGNLLQTILLAMVQSMGDQAINGVLQMLSNEMIAREHADGLLSQALTAEQRRAIAAETKSAVLNGETKTLVFKNAAGQELYQVSVESLISNGLVDVELDGTNLVMTFHTESGNEEITIPIGEIFNPSNYYTKTQIDGLLLPLSRAITRINDTLHEGALYAGYATPETIPTEHEGASLFYIATEEGEYIHFFSNGDIPVVIQTPGIHLIVGGIEADDWHYETIVTFTNDVQFNNAHLITSGGVFNAILPINELLHRNYILAGVAYTTTIPTEDTNVFYLAGQGGTYTNFLNGSEEPLVLPKGLTVIYRGVEDDGWNYWVVYADNDFINTNRAQALTSNQQTEAQNNLEGKLYEPAQFSGLGKKILAKNIQQVGGVDKNVMTQAFFEDEQGNALTNTVFIIQYDYDLNEATITIPNGSHLIFDSGSISNGHLLVGSNTIIEGSGKFFLSHNLTKDENNKDILKILGNNNIIRDIEIYSDIEPGYTQKDIDDVIIGIQVYNGTNISVSNVHIHNVSACMGIDTASEVRVTDNYFHDSYSRVETDYGYGININQCTDVAILNNDMHNIERHAIYVSLHTDGQAWTKNLIVSNNIIRSYVKSTYYMWEFMIKIMSSDGVLVSNNIVYGRYGILMNPEFVDGGSVTISDNEFVVDYDCLVVMPSAKSLSAKCFDRFILKGNIFKTNNRLAGFATIGSINYIEILNNKIINSDGDCSNYAYNLRLTSDGLITTIKKFISKGNSFVNFGGYIYANNVELLDLDDAIKYSYYGTIRPIARTEAVTYGNVRLSPVDNDSYIDYYTTNNRDYYWSLQYWDRNFEKEIRYNFAGVWKDIVGNAL